MGMWYFTLIFAIMKMILCFIACGLLLVHCSAQENNNPLPVNDDNNSLLWRISGNGNSEPSYLFGTFHLLCKEDIHFSSALKTALSRSDTIYMELDMDDPSVMLSAMMYMNMDSGKTLKSLYTEEEYQRLSDYFKDSLNMSLSMFARAKPFFLVALFYPRMMDCNQPSGVEAALIKLANENSKEIKGLETMKFQASVFDSIPYEWQADELLKNIDSFEVAKREFEDMLRLYKNQNLDSIAIMINESEFGDGQFQEQLLSNRNKKWVAYLDSIMKYQSVFVAVGAGHLPGKYGVIQLLQELGYTVDPLKNEG